jgi:HhH-GPD superfamily base excision DNA repair protein
MLQQTRVVAIVRYWIRWMDRFPTLHHLAAAIDDKVNSLWAGLGFTSAARLLVNTTDNDDNTNNNNNNGDVDDQRAAWKVKPKPTKATTNDEDDDENENDCAPGTEHLLLTTTVAGLMKLYYLCRNEQDRIVQLVYKSKESDVQTNNYAW